MAKKIDRLLELVEDGLVVIGGTGRVEWVPVKAEDLRRDEEDDEELESKGQ